MDVMEKTVESNRNLSRKHSNLDEECETEQQNVKKVRLFSAKEFRNQLNTGAKLPALQAFFEAINDKKHDYVIDYLENGGNCLELLQTLELDSTISPALVFNLVNRVLLNIISNYPQFHSSALESCRYMLKNYISVINKMINLSSSTHERTVVLKLLTTIVTFSGTLAKDVLLNVNFHQTNLELLTKHTGERNSVRDVFIYFLTAFLVDGQYPTLSVLLEKKGLITSIISGLQYDVADTVCIVLTAMKNHILENPFVSKTAKMKTFNTLVVRDIVSLYNWKGPEAFKAQKNKKLAVTVEEYAKSKVSECVHDFLVVLCTSHKFGVVFKDPLVGLGKKNQNALIFTVLQSLERPWEHSYAGQLVTKICGACPDLTKTMWANLKPFLELRLTRKWLNAMDFAKVLLTELQPNCIEFCVKDLTVYQLGQIISFLVAPLPILKTIIPENNVYEHQAIKQSVVLLLLDMLKALDAYLKAAETWLSTENYKKLKNYCSGHISRHFPDAKLILTGWETEETLDEDLGLTIKNFDYLNSVFDILNYYKSFAPQLLDSLNISELNLQEFMSKVDEKCENNAQQLQIKIINIFVDFDQSQFLPNKGDLFTFTVPLLLRYYHESNDSQTLNVLGKLLSNTGIFDGCLYEINVWLNGVLNLKTFDQEVAESLVEIIKTTSENVFELLQILSECKETSDSSGNYAEILENLINPNAASGEQILLKNKHLSPLIVGFLKHLQNNEVTKGLKSYSQFVLVNLFHSQTQFRVFYNLTSKYQEVVPKNVTEYVKNWTINAEPSEIKKFKGSLDVFQSFSENFLNDNVEVFLKQNKDKLNDYEDLKFNLLETGVFYFCNLLNLGNITQKQAENCEKFVKFLIKYDCNFNSKYYEAILGNPLIVNNFSLLQLQEATPTSHCTNFIITTVKELFSANHNIESYLKVYRKKMLHAILKVVKKPQKYTQLLNFVDILQVIRLNYNHVVEILTLLPSFIKKTDNNQLVYDITVYCLSQIASLCEENSTLDPLAEEITSGLNSYFMQINQNQQINSQSFSVALKKYLTTFPHQIASFGKGLFQSLLNLTEVNKETVALCVFLLERNTSLVNCLRENLETVCERKGIILPLLNVIAESTTEEELLQKIYLKIEPAVAKALQKPQKAGQNFMQYSSGVGVLLQKFMPVEKCLAYVEKVQKYEGTEVFHVALLEKIANKVIENGPNTKQTNNIILIFIHLEMNVLKRKTKSDDDWLKLAEVSTIFNNTLIKLQQAKNPSGDLKSLTENETFKLFCKFCLKFGVSGHVTFIKVLRNLINLLSSCFELEDAKLILDMLLSHSEFIEKLLGPQSESKDEILFLFLELCKNWSGLMERGHIPVLLSAYKAMITRSDRTILTLLKMYELNAGKTQFYDFKPFLWDRAAASHYSVRSNVENNLWRQPKMGDVLDILQDQAVNATILHYPVKDNLNTSQINSEEKHEKIYDLGFLLPLFSQLLAQENQVQTYRFSRSGALSLTIIGLSNENKEVRQAACHVLSRFYFHVEARQTGKDNLLWIRFVEAVCKGTAILPDFKLNSFSAIYLARMAMVLTQPNHVMYVPLTQYLTAKSSLDFSTIPELYTFLHSPDLNFREHRHFLLELLRDGLRSEGDFTDFLRSMAFKLFSELYSSSISDLETKLLILDVINSVCKIPLGVKMLCENHSLLTQLFTILMDVVKFSVNEKKHAHLYVNKIVPILNNIVKVKDLKHSNLMVFNMLIMVVNNDVFEMLNEETLVIYYEAIYLVFTRFPDLVEDKHIDILLKKNTDKVCKYIFQHGCHFISEQSLGKDTNYFLRMLIFNKFKR